MANATMPSDAPPLRPFVLLPAHLQGLRWSIERARLAGLKLYPIDLQQLEALVERADPEAAARAYYSPPPPPPLEDSPGRAERRPLWPWGRR